MGGFATRPTPTPSAANLGGKGGLEDTEVNLYAVWFYENVELIAAMGIVEIETIWLEEGAKVEFGATFACRKPA